MQTALKTAPHEVRDTISGYYAYPELNPSEVVLAATIPPDESLPAIEGNDGNFYTLGVKLEFDADWPQGSVTVILTLEGATGWSIEGWTEESSDADSTTWRREIPSSVVSDMLAHTGNSWTLSFKFVHTSGASHDPGIIVTRPT